MSNHEDKDRSPYDNAKICPECGHVLESGTEEVYVDGKKFYYNCWLCGNCGYKKRTSGPIPARS